MTDYHKIPYRWQMVHRLQVLKDNVTQDICDLMEAAGLLATLGLPQDSLVTTGQDVAERASHKWNPATAKTFTPRGQQPASGTADVT
ncbi:Hypothetical predicted protein [Pelobates cultripes]|uniref:Uncharacterized protein n=1 Tax=Pelobates cultripes TaxID=61616 RepID=A0AAD1SVA4_PELCU|nr:Hypothetical predicted protein [Pelobates cultripes]